MKKIREDRFLGRGWGFPPSFTKGGADLEMVAGVDDIEQSIQILLGTRQMERIRQEDFGCNLDVFLFESPSQHLLTEIEDEVKEVLLFHEPRILTEKVTVDASRLGEGILLINIQYIVRFNNTRYNMVYPYYFREATDIPQG